MPDLFNDLSDCTDDELLTECRRRGLTPTATLPAVSPWAALAFEEFWTRYPRKVSKREAAKAWERLAPEQRSKAIAVIERHTWMWVQEGRGTATIPHASTWLNQWRFDDEIGFVAPSDTRPVSNGHTRSDDVLRQMGGS